MHKVKTTETIETKPQTLLVPYIIKHLILVDAWYYTKIKMTNDGNSICLTQSSGKTATDK